MNGDLEHVQMLKTSERIKSYNDLTAEEVKIYNIAYREACSWINSITDIESWDMDTYTESICYYLDIVERLDLYEAIPRLLKEELEEELKEYYEELEAEEEEEN